MKIHHKNIYKYLFILIFVFISEAFSQGKIIGLVRDKRDYTPIKNATVSIYSNSDSIKLSGTNTDGTGFFAFNNLKSGNYGIEVVFKGYASYKIKNIQLFDKKQDYLFDTIKLSSSQFKADEIVLKNEIGFTDIKDNNRINYDEDVIKTGKGKIIGTVRDAKDFTPIKDAVVLIFNNNDSTKLTGTGTDGTGFFAFNNLEYGKYKIEVSFIGYAVYKVKNIQINDVNPTINIDTIKLSTSHFRTEEILVQDEKPLMEFNDDKKVFNIEKIMTSRGGTAIDVLRKLPMVEVDAQDNVSLRGSKNLMILIDNKPMKFASLRQLPADAIKNVEIITNPSAKYEAEGVTGILNIVLKSNENKGVGYNGYLYSGLRNNESYNTGVSIDVKKRKWSFFINGGMGNYKFNSSNTSEITYFQPASFLNSSSSGNGNSKYGYGGIGIEYEFKKNHNIGFDAYLNSNKFNSTSNSQSNNYNASDILSSMYKNNYSSDGIWNNYSTSLYYNGKFDKIGKELNIDVSYNKADNNNNSNQLIQYYDSLLTPVNNTPSNQSNFTNGKNENLKIQLDYSNPFNDKTKFETGYKGIFRSNDNDFRSDTLNYILNTYVRNDNVTNHFKLSEYIDAVYGTFSHKIKKFRFKLGLRLEHTYTKGELITDGTNFTKDYLDLFPSLSISQKLGMSHELQLSYSRRITRPMIYRLNPFVNRYDLKFINVGNPELKPEYSDSYELSYMFISNPINITPIVFYRRSTNVITNYSYIIDTNVTVTTYRNSSSGYSYGMDFIISSRALQWWNINSTFSFYETKYNTDVTSDYSGEEGFSWKANIRSFFTIGDLFNIEVYYEYTGKRIKATGFNTPMQSFDMSINKTFFKKKLTVGIRGEDLFKTRKWGSETNGVGVKSVYDYRWDSRGVYLNINYNFGNSEKYYKKTKNTKQNENEKSDSNEQGNK
jgi:outer membrane receptor protein involved in Fe transport